MIREFVLDDLEEIMGIWLEQNIEAHAFIAKDYWYKNYALVADLIPQAQIYVYVYAGKILGFIGLQTEYIAGLFVRQKYQGIGKKLLTYAKQRNKRLYLDVYCANQQAVSFYQKQGFVILDKQYIADVKQNQYHMIWNESY